ncbi:MAG TPA: YggT family protein [Dehalococcoidia bacterium]|jgi:YggT family protein|nr:YggT family protein [Chloroflexota bacterium]MDP6055667.1 YggT family protein [Dehalococcoidia bacterium]MDP7090172.1 YggT family protein [Dehalococcoidia bacterium]MDP7261252.1 YggT family protein [Dehalococcoidia bacterium]MDP7485378.1 YggT family protein [Dehalococcoidia bacterium]|tara:strand:+ start:2204 stop:2467 length:264 start_codon:yes stop_codon:yes gene_type:complete
MSDDFLAYIGWLLRIFAYLIVARAFSSWFPDARRHTIIQLLYQVTDPVMIPASRLIPRIGMIDISPMIVILVLFAISSALMGEASGS